MLKTCPKCNGQYEYDPSTGTKYRYICPACEKLRQREYNRKHNARRRGKREKKAAKDHFRPSGEILKVKGYRFDQWTSDAQIWADWQAPLDHITKLMLLAGDLPTGLIVQIDNGPLLVVQRSPGGNNYLVEAA